tara:strand:+ start:3551 stop:3820 length:270 start_codon:yes stop_codon:yes gene_type:complete
MVYFRNIDKKNVIQLIAFKAIKIKEYNNIEEDKKKIEKNYFIGDIHHNRQSLTKLELKGELVKKAIVKLEKEIGFYQSLGLCAENKVLH